MPYLRANGVRLRYEAWGDGVEPLVLLHGLGSSAGDWLLQQPAFAPHFRCLAVDLRGHGQSEKPAGPYSIRLFATDVLALLAGLNALPAHVLGLSLGGLVAQQIAIMRPAVVRSLILINTFPGLWPPPPSLLWAGRYRLPALLRRAPMAETAARVALRLFPKPEQALLRQEAEQHLAANDPAAYRAALRAILRFRPGPAVSRITCPVLVIAGDRDTIVPLMYKRRLCRCLPQAHFLLVPDSGHASNVDQPDIVNRATLDFLQRLPSLLRG